MQGRDDGSRDFLDLSSFAGHLLPVGSVFAFLAEHRHRLFPDEMFADLFPSGRGRPSLPGDVAASVLVLQALHGYSDREAADAVAFDLRWKAACGFTIDAAGFHPSTLTYGRRRLAASDRPHRIFDAVRDVIAQTGAIAGKMRRALDSTILDDAVARQDIAGLHPVGQVTPGGQGQIESMTPKLSEVGIHLLVQFQRVDLPDFAIQVSGEDRGHHRSMSAVLSEQIPGRVRLDHLLEAERTNQHRHGSLRLSVASDDQWEAPECRTISGYVDAPPGGCRGPR